MTPMSLSEVVLAATTILAVVTAIAAVVRDRRKPELDEAQAKSAIVNSDAVKAEIKRMSDESNIRRDLRILDLEHWGDQMRPWISAVTHRDTEMLDLIREDRVRCELPMPDLTPLPEPPQFPPPRPLPIPK